MNKAFVKDTGNEDDDGDEALPGAPALPAGARNYMTAKGYARLQSELEDLVKRERPALVKTVAWLPATVTVRKRRLHLRQEASARNRPAHPLPDAAAGEC